MKRVFAAVALLVLALAGCGKKEDAANPAAEGPPPAKVEKEGDASLVKVDHPEKFPLATAEQHSAAPELNVTGVVSPDVARTVPVISLASGRVVEINARLGDEVKKGQLLFKVRSSDMSGAFSDYRKAVVTEQLTKVQLDRAKLLFDKGAIAKKELEVAQNAEDSALVDLDTFSERLKLLGGDTNHPTGIVDVFAPVSGVITEQNITQSAGVKTFGQFAQPVYDCRPFRGLDRVRRVRKRRAEHKNGGICGHPSGGVSQPGA